MLRPKPMSQEADFRTANSADSLNRLLSGQWFQNNRLATLTIFINSWLLVAARFLIMLFGVVLSVLMKFTETLSIKSYGQGLSGLPQLLRLADRGGRSRLCDGRNPAHVLTGLGTAFMAKGLCGFTGRLISKMPKRGSQVGGPGGPSRCGF